MQTLRALIDIRQGRKPTGIGEYGMQLSKALASLDPGAYVPVVAEHQTGVLNAEQKPFVLEEGAHPDTQALRGFDIFHGTNFTVPDVPAAQVATVHDIGFLLLPECHPAGFSELLDRKLKEQLERVDAFVCDSRWTRDTFREHYAVTADRCHVAHLGVASDFFAGDRLDHQPDEVSRKISQAIRRPFLLHVGAMIRRKDLGTLMEVFQAVATSTDDLDLVLVGNRTRRWASDWPRVRHWLLRHPRLARRVHVLDYVPRAVLPGLYARAAAVISTSLLEGFGLTVLEAAAAGTAVVATEGSAVSEVAGPGSRLAQTRDVESYVNAVFSALSVGRDELDAGRRHARGFTWARTAEDVVSCYQAVC